MDPRITQSSDVVSTNESLTRIGQRPGVQPSAVLPRTNPERSQRAYCPDIEKRARALHWALDRVARRSLPGEGYVEEYLGVSWGRVLYFSISILYQKTKIQNPALF